MLLLDQSHWVRRVSTPVSRNLCSRPIKPASTVVQGTPHKAWSWPNLASVNLQRGWRSDGFLKSCNSLKRSGMCVIRHIIIELGEQHRLLYISILVSTSLIKTERHRWIAIKNHEWQECHFRCSSSATCCRPCNSYSRVFVDPVVYSVVNDCPTLLRMVLRAGG